MMYTFVYMNDSIGHGRGPFPVAPAPQADSAAYTAGTEVSGQETSEGFKHLNAHVWSIMISINTLYIHKNIYIYINRCMSVYVFTILFVYIYTYIYTYKCFNGQ